MDNHIQTAESEVSAITRPSDSICEFAHCSMLEHIIRLIRVRHWIKNGFVFVPLLLLFALPTPSQIIRCTLGAFLFCLICSSVYIMNDIVDVAKDRAHPVKKMRPIASGAVPMTIAYILLGLLFVSGLAIACLFDIVVAAVLLGYFVMNIAYSFLLKNLIFIDVFTISLGFILRLYVGFRILGLSIGYSPNLWFALFVTFLTLFLGMGKRHGELKMLGENSTEVRQSLSDYSLEQLEQIIGTLMTCTILAYTMFLFQTQQVLLFTTLPLLLYSVFRYRFLEGKNNLHGSPEMIIYKDRPIRICVILWAILLIGICVGHTYIM